MRSLSFPPALAALIACYVPFLALLSEFVAASPYTPGVRRATTCNGSPDLCARSFGNVTFVGTHDSYAVGVNNLAANQDYNISQQLKDGIRMLQVQAHNQSGTIELCHTSCLLYDGGPLSAYLQTVKSWLDANPNDVLSILVVNSDGFPPTAYDSLYKSAGLDTVSYSPPSASMPASQWPTLGTLIDSGTRLITFMDTNADFASVPYIISEFTNIWETPYDVTTTFDCSVNRTGGDPSTQMYLINHFLDQMLLGQPVPDPGQANETNAVSGPNSLGAQLELCVSEYGRNPNFMLVDFYEYGGGSVFEVAAAANGVTYNPSTPIATPIPQTNSSGSGGSNSSANSAPLSGFGPGTVGLLISGVVLGNGYILW
ncbi:PLC-like phosphodiesterase [Pisolithus orientalis]|uniref:PLC-like phosphodiesterase n=1 Tax=Pisolithus orientalis TaxID=936130 RepID=UPI0022241706|nr:PLC-like phosphodiesterase [Pisolithus orientalis]KAI6008378.1 PLC-like phosphodiesterase [Pisolithus orientalis]